MGGLNDAIFVSLSADPIMASIIRSTIPRLEDAMIVIVVLVLVLLILGCFVD